MGINYTKLDSFFIEDVMSKSDREKIQIIDLNLLNIFIRLVSRNLNLSFRDAHVLVFSMGNHAIAAFTDTLFRINKGANEQIPANSVLALNCFEEFYQNRNCHISNSRKLRCQIANFISQEKGLSQPFKLSLVEEFEKSSIQDLNLKQCEQEKFWKKLFFWKYRIWDGATSLAAIFASRCVNLFIFKMTRVGHTNMRLKYLLQLTGIKYIDLNPLRDDFFFSYESREARLSFYNSFVEEFVKEGLKEKEWMDLFGEDNASGLLTVLFALIVTQVPCYVFHPERVAGAIDSLVTQLEKLKIDLIITLGGWSNPLLPIAGHKLGLNVGIYQHGGRDLYSPGTGFENEKLCVNDFYLAWGWTRSEDKIGKPEFFKISDPALEKLSLRGKKTSIQNAEVFRVLYSPVASSVLYNIEHCRSFTPEFMPLHRKRVREIFEELDRSVENGKVDLYMKLKGFDAHIFKNHEYMFFPDLELKNISVKFILSGYTSDYFEHFDLHFIDGMSTTFDESMAFNLPTTVFCNKDILKLRSEFSKLVSRMEQQHVIGYDNQTVVDNILYALKNRSWWNEKEVQDTRNDYVMEFSRHDGNWKKGIKQALLLNARK